MIYNTLEEILRAAATSADINIRAFATMKLQELRDIDSQAFLQTLLEVLKSPSQEIHIIAYSYLLNGWILKVNRLAYDLPSKLQELYLYYQHLEQEQFTLGFNKYRFRMENLVRLTVAYYVKPQHMRFAEEFIKKIALQMGKNEARYLLPFYTEVLQGMNQLTEPSLRVRIGIKAANLLSKSLESHWQVGGQQGIRFIIAASYYLSIFSNNLFERMIPYINSQNINDAMLWKIVDRLKSAFLDNKFNPSFQKSIEVYNRTKALARGINISQFKKKSYDLEENGKFGQQYEKLIKLFSDLLDLITGCLGCLFRINMNENQSKYLQQLILNLREYDDLVIWLIQVNSYFEEGSEVQIDHNLKEKVLDIISIISDRMSDEDLNHYFEKIKQNMNPENQEQILSLLFGANKQILDLFDCESIVIKMVTHQFEIPLKGSFIYYLFIGKYLKANEYFVSQALFGDIYQFLMHHIELHETLLNTSINVKHSSHHILKISHLLIIGTQLINYPWTLQYREYLPFMIKKIFYYLANSFLGLPETAHENLYEAILSVVSKNNLIINSTIAQHVRDIYRQCFLSGSPVDLSKRRLTCRIQQELLIILQKSLNLIDLKDHQIRFQLNTIINKPPEHDEIILKETINLLLKVVSLYNSKFLNLTQLQFCNQQQNYFQVPFEKINPLLLESLNLSQSFEQLLELLNSNYEQMFCSLIDEILNNFTTTVQLLIELSLYTSYHQFVDYMTIQMMQSLQKSRIIYRQVLKKSHLKPLMMKNAANRLQKIPLYAQCFLESLYLNPYWKTTVTPEKLRIAKQPLFCNCKANIDTLYASTITEMMKNISLEEQHKNAIIWSNKYSELQIKDSVATTIIDGWFVNFRAIESL